MNLRELIDLGAQIAGSNKELAEQIGISRTLLQDAKAGRQALPLIACGKLAELTKTDKWEAAAAAKAAHTNDPKERAYFERFTVQKAAAIAALAFALVILEMTPTDAQAALLLGIDSGAIGIM